MVARPLAYRERPIKARSTLVIGQGQRLDAIDVWFDDIAKWTAEAVRAATVDYAAKVGSVPTGEEGGPGKLEVNAYAYHHPLRNFGKTPRKKLLDLS